jgi:hypothetical protein
MSRRTVRVLAIVAVSLVALLIAADRVGLYVAERIAGDTIESSQHLNSRPDVDIAGFPFLNQLVTGKYDKITITANDVPVGLATRPLDLSRVRVVLHSLTVSRDFHSVHADTADATATITYAELGKSLGVDVSYAGSGRIRASKTITVAGVSVAASVTTQPRVSGGSLSFAQTRVENAGRLSDTAVTAIERLFNVTIPLRGVRFDVRVRSLEAAADGVTIALTGRNLAYST